jgi:hypothetical protein
MMYSFKGQKKISSVSSVSMTQAAPLQRKIDLSAGLRAAPAISTSKVLQSGLAEQTNHTQSTSNGIPILEKILSHSPEEGSLPLQLKVAPRDQPRLDSAVIHAQALQGGPVEALPNSNST